MLRNPITFSRTCYTYSKIKTERGKCEWVAMWGEKGLKVASAAADFRVVNRETAWVD